MNYDNFFTFNQSINHSFNFRFLHDMNEGD